MKPFRARPPTAVLLALVLAMPFQGRGPGEDSLVDGPYRATVRAEETGGVRSYELTSNAPLRDNDPPDKRVEFHEIPGHAHVRSGSLMFDCLYALAVTEAVRN